MNLDGYGGFATTDRAAEAASLPSSISPAQSPIAIGTTARCPLTSAVNADDIPLLVYSNPGNEALIIASSYDSADADAQVEIDWRALGLSAASSIARDAETGAPLTVRDGKIIFPLKRHDLKLIHLSK